MMKFNSDFYWAFEGATVRFSGRLPHVELDNGIYSVTFRLGDSLPIEKVNRLRTERERFLAQPDLTLIERLRFDEAWSLRFDGELDRSLGQCVLRRDDCASEVASTLRHFDGERYELFSWCVMPNHVHVLFRLHRGDDLPDVLHSWKSYTAKTINRLLGRTGVVWQRGYFDRLIRGAKDFRQTERYIRENPLKAGLKEWKWVADPEDVAKAIKVLAI